jgi:dipeptidase E
LIGLRDATVPLVDAVLGAMRLAPLIRLHGDGGALSERKRQHHRRHTVVPEGKVFMKLLLTSSGINNPSIADALVDLLGKPIAESSALFIPTAIYPFPDGAGKAFQAICGNAKSPLCDLGWKSVGVLELTALPSIDKEVWVATVQKSDALLVWGGDPVYLSYWMKHSGLADLLPSLRPETVYVGVSAGSIAMASTFGETYVDPPKCSGDRLWSEDIVFAGPEGEVTMTLVMAEGVGLVDFAIIPHVEYDDHQDVANAEKWAGRLPVPAYAIDDETAVKVIDGTVEIVSEGRWKLFNP